MCTIGSPAIGKNVLAVGASSSGRTGFTRTNADGEELAVGDTSADIDTVAFFSSYGPSTDNRIKPEIVAPGDGVRAWYDVCRERGLGCKYVFTAEGVRVTRRRYQRNYLYGVGVSLGESSLTGVARDTSERLAG